MTLNNCPEPSWIGEAPNEPRPEEIACCPSCQSSFIEKDGIDVEQGEVCCSIQCVEQYELLDHD